MIVSDEGDEERCIDRREGRGRFKRWIYEYEGDARSYLIALSVVNVGCGTDESGFVPDSEVAFRAE